MASYNVRVNGRNLRGVFVFLFLPCVYVYVTADVTVVEQVADSASLYSRSIRDHHVCLLVKKVVRILLRSY